MTLEEFCKEFKSGHIRVNIYDVNLAITDLISAYECQRVIIEAVREEIESLRHERDTLLETNNGFKAGLMRVLGTEHETYNEYLTEIAALKSNAGNMK